MKDYMHVPFCNLSGVPNPHLPVEVEENFGTDLTYKWVEYVPFKYDPRKAVPLVVKLHGGGGTGPKTYMTTSWAALAEKKGFICIFPTANQAHSWIADKPDDDRDIDYIMKITDHVMKKYNIDSTRVYLTGMSFGDMMSYAVAGERGNVFAALASYGGPTPPDMAAKRPRKAALPVIQIRGEADVLGPGIEYMSFDESFAVKNPYMSYARKAWIEKNNCVHVPQIRMEGDQNISTYRGQNGDLVFLETKDMPHVESAWSTEFVWDEFFTCYARVNGKVVRVKESGFLKAQSEDYAVAAGSSYVYVKGEVKNLDADDEWASAVIAKQEEGDATFMGPFYRESCYWKDVVMAPIQFVKTLFGAEVKVDMHPVMPTAAIEYQGSRYEYTGSSMFATKDGKYISMLNGAWVEDGKFFVPVAQIAEHLGFQAQTVSGVVYISAKPFKLGRWTAEIIKEIL